MTARPTSPTFSETTPRPGLTFLVIVFCVCTPTADDINPAVPIIRDIP